MSKRGRPNLQVPPICVAVRPQLHSSDCAIQAISMALGVDYEDVLKHAPIAVRDGLSPQRFHRLGRALGVRFVRDDKADLDEDTGLLWVEFRTAAHLVYVHQGVLINPADATVWGCPADYLEQHEADAFFYRITPCLQR